MARRDRKALLDEIEAIDRSWGKIQAKFNTGRRLTRRERRRLWRCMVNQASAMTKLVAERDS